MSGQDPYDIDGQEERKEALRASNSVASKAADRDFLWLMSSEKGRRVVRQLIAVAGVFKSSFGPNAMQMAHDEGRKWVGFWALDQIERLCPKAYRTMMEENPND